MPKNLAVQLLYWGISWVLTSLLLAMALGAQAQVITADGFSATEVLNTAGHLPYANPHAKKGGVLSLAAQGSFDSLNPFIDQGVAAQGSFYLYDTLMTGSLDEVGVGYAQLAAQVTYDDADDSWVIFHIHPKARFWDGTPVTAKDVKATFDAILAQGLVSWRSYLSGINDIEVLDELRIKFTFASDRGRQLRSSVAAMPIFAKASIDAHFTKPTLTPLMGSGAYRLGKVVRGRSVEYVRDSNYWGRHLPVNVGRFNFDVIRYHYYHSDEMAFEAFKAGHYSFRIEKNAKLWANAHKLPSVQSGAVVQALIQDANPIPFYGLMINTRKKPFNDLALRQALVVAYDFDWTNRALLYGQKQRLTSFFHGSSLSRQAADETVSALLTRLPLNETERRGLKAPIGMSYGMYHRQALLWARQLLLTAGYHYQAGQLMDRDGQAVRLEILVGDDSLNRLLLAYLANLKRLGITARIRQMDKASFYERRRAFDFDMTPQIIYQGNSPSSEQAYLWGAQAADSLGSQNLSGVKSVAVDALIDDLIDVQSQPKATAKVQPLVQALDTLLWAGAYTVPLYADVGTQLLYDRHYQHPIPLPRYALGLDYWWATDVATKNP